MQAGRLTEAYRVDRLNDPPNRTADGQIVKDDWADTPFMDRIWGTRPKPLTGTEEFKAGGFGAVSRSVIEIYALPGLNTTMRFAWLPSGRTLDILAINESERDCWKVTVQEGRSKGS